MAGLSSRSSTGSDEDEVTSFYTQRRSGPPSGLTPHSSPNPLPQKGGRNAPAPPSMRYAHHENSAIAIPPPADSYAPLTLAHDLPPLSQSAVLSTDARFGLTPPRGTVRSTFVQRPKGMLGLLAGVSIAVVVAAVALLIGRPHSRMKSPGSDDSSRTAANSIPDEPGSLGALKTQAGASQLQSPAPMTAGEPATASEPSVIHADSVLPSEPMRGNGASLRHGLTGRARPKSPATPKRVAEGRTALSDAEDGNPVAPPKREPRAARTPVHSANVSGDELKVVAMAPEPKPKAEKAEKQDRSEKAEKPDKAAKGKTDAELAQAQKARDAANEAIGDSLGN
jgi:hypothetical protein